MKKVRIAINGFGRIGRALFRLVHGRDDVEVVAVNDLGSVDNLAYLLHYDTVYGRAAFDVVATADSLSAGGVAVPFFSIKNPAELPWKKLGVDVVVEATGVFDDYEKAKAHLDAGATRVVITAPVKAEVLDLGATVLPGINEDTLASVSITSNGSCTTLSVAPVIAIIDGAIGIDKALLTTTHAYTASQGLVDGPVPHASKTSDLRRGRAAAANIVPSSTGSAVAVAKAYEGLAGKFDGISLRVPVTIGSISDITFVTKRETSVEEVNDVLTKAAREVCWEHLFDVAEDQLVSSDIIGNPHMSIAQLDMTRVVGGNLVKVLAWYDNEAGYTNALVSHILAAGKYV